MVTKYFVGDFPFVICEKKYKKFTERKSFCDKINEKIFPKRMQFHVKKI
jgi:hypothetical protein